MLTSREKRNLHIFGLSETKLKSHKMTSAFTIDGFQTPFLTRLTRPVVGLNPTLTTFEKAMFLECVKLAWNLQLWIRFGGLLGLELG